MNKYYYIFFPLLIVLIVTSYTLLNDKDIAVIEEVLYYPTENNEERLLIKFDHNFKNIADIPTANSQEFNYLGEIGEVTEKNKRLYSKFYLKLLNLDQLNNIITNQDRKYGFILLNYATFQSDEEYITHYFGEAGVVNSVYAFKTKVREMPIVILLVVMNHIDSEWVSSGKIYNPDNKEVGVKIDFRRIN